MLEEVRERTSSVLISALGAWLGLGAGLALMVFSLLAVSWLVLEGGSTSEDSTVLVQRVSQDLTSLQTDGASLSEDGLVLTLETQANSQANSTVIYTVQNSRLTRADDAGEITWIARLDGLQFSVEGNRLLAKWNSNGKRRSETWALDRWQTR